jgi:hypothetical protein
VAGFILVALPNGPGQVIVGAILLIACSAAADHAGNGGQAGPNEASGSRPFVMYLER